MKKSSILLIILMLIVVFFAFWKTAQNDLQEWDESRNGVNAYEMIHNHDYVNLYYNNDLDTWNAKPPLLIWLITFSYQLFGYNELALRIPTLISSILLFLVVFLMIKKFEGAHKAFITCLILISCKAIFSNHLGKTGDFDVLLMLFLTLSAYCFIIYIEEDRKYALLLSALFTGLAFYTKGTASLLFIPGFFLYATFRKKIIFLLRDRNFYFSILLFFLIVGSWVGLVNTYGKTATNTYYKSNSAIETMLMHDTFQRLTNPDFGPASERSYLFVIHVLDAKLNLWNYIFYLSILFGIVNIIKNKNNIKHYLYEKSNKFTLFSICLFIPIALILTFTRNQNFWYLAPIFPFIAYIIANGVNILINKSKLYFYILTLLFSFTFFRQAYYLYSEPKNLHINLSNNATLKNKNVIIIKEPKQSVLLYLKWMNTTTIKVENINEVIKWKGQTILFEINEENKDLQNTIQPISIFEGNLLGIIK